MAEWTEGQHDRIKQVLHNLGYLRKNTLVLDNGSTGVSFGDVCDAIEEIERLRVWVKHGHKTKEYDEALLRAGEEAYPTAPPMPRYRMEQ